jgi:Uncharacterized conserved protein
MTAKVVVLGALDTKGIECQYLKDLIEKAGVPTLTVNTGVLGESYFQADVSSTRVAELSGTRLERLIADYDRGKAVEAMMNGAIKLVKELHHKGEVLGIIGIGGSAGTTIASAAMQLLPIGMPKVMVSTIASGNVQPYVGMKDITMMNTIADISGLNRISRPILTNAAYAMIGMVQGELPKGEADKPVIAVSMFGVTTACVTAARGYLEQRGCEVVPFHATGIGGKAMESFISAGMISGVLDITTTEIADEVAGGLLSAGPERLEAAGRRGIPQVVSVGAVDMANFAGPDTIPEHFRSRRLVKHNPTVTLMRTSVEENRLIGESIAFKLNQSSTKTAVFLPLKGVSALDCEGMPFYGPEENKALFSAIRNNLHADIELYEADCHINEESFAIAMADKLLTLMEATHNQEEL